jgi:hypothetical protein
VWGPGIGCPPGFLTGNHNMLCRYRLLKHQLLEGVQNMVVVGRPVVPIARGVTAPKLPRGEHDSVEVVGTFAVTART